MRYLETLTVIAADKNSTIVFPRPLEVIGLLVQALERKAGMRLWRNQKRRGRLRGPFFLLDWL